MKKFFSALLALMMVLAMGIPTYAATIGSNGGTQSIDVKAKYVDSTSSNTIYSIDVSWGAMEFTYTASGTQVWNPETHEYTSSVSGAWTGSGNQVAVTNHSNTGITASFTFAPESGYTGLAGTFSQSSFGLPSAVGKATNASELTGTTALTLGGTLANTVTTMTKVGTVTVTIS